MCCMYVICAVTVASADSNELADFLVGPGDITKSCGVSGIAVDLFGNVYVSDSCDEIVRIIRLQGL